MHFTIPLPFIKALSLASCLGRSPRLHTSVHASAWYVTDHKYINKYFITYLQIHFTLGCLVQRAAEPCRTSQTFRQEPGEDEPALHWGKGCTCVFIETYFVYAFKQVRTELLRTFISQ